MSVVWVNGTLTDKAAAKVGLFDHGLLYGDGVWEPLRVFGGRLFRGDDHVRELFRAARLVGIDIPHTPAELLAAVGATVAANQRVEGYCRVIVTRGAGTIGPDPRKLDPQVYITAEEYYPFPVELNAHGLHVVTSPYRVDRENPFCRVRALGRPDVAQAKRHALHHGCLDAILTDLTGQVIGTTEGGLFGVRGGKVAFLPAGHSPETAAVQDLLRGKYAEWPSDGATPDDLARADEVLLVGTSCGVIGVVRIDGRDVGTGTEGPVTRAIREEYRRLTRGGVE